MPIESVASIVGFGTLMFSILFYVYFFREKGWRWPEGDEVSPFLLATIVIAVFAFSPFY
jgi:hypothetical protein